jgi:hypothetical protein
MELNELETAATPAQLGAAVDLYHDDLHLLHQMHDHGAGSVRHVTYKGHDIRITTTYAIELDGVEITGHLLVNNAGTVHYHAIPNQEFASAVDLVKRIVDLTDGVDEPDESAAPGPHHHHGG